MPTVRIHYPGNEAPTLLNLNGNRITIGRLPHNTIQIIDRTISALHAEFIKEGDHYRLHDRGSSNGTFVNGELVTDYHLKDACRIAFGVFECEFSPAIAAPVSDESAEVLPSRGEINEVRHENVKLRNQVELFREELETIRQLPTVGSGEEVDLVPKAEFIRIVDEKEKIKEALLHSGEEVKRLKNDLAVLQRDRENLQRAWDDAKAELLKARTASAKGGVAHVVAIHESEDAADAPLPEPLEAKIEEVESPVLSEPVPAPEEPKAAPKFMPVARPAVLPKPFVPPSVATVPRAEPTVTKAQPFVPAATPKVQPANGSGIRPFPKANPPGTPPRPGLAGSRPLESGSQMPKKGTAPLSPKPFQRPVAKLPTAAGGGAGPKGTQKIPIAPQDPDLG